MRMPERNGFIEAAFKEERPLFLVWGSPYRGPRSLVLARELGIPDLHYLYCTSRRGLLSALFKYPYQAIGSLWLLFRKRPSLVFVQSPPSFAIIFVYLYCRLTGASYVVDAHSAAFQVSAWKRPESLYRHLARNALTTIVTNERFQQAIQAWGASAFVLRDVPTHFDIKSRCTLNGGFHVAVVNSYSIDEPLAEILEAARKLPRVSFHISGDKRMAPRQLLTSAPTNVRFTGFLPDQEYYALLNAAHAVLCLTTRDMTMQRGGCEALSLGKPMIVSDWPILRNYFHRGAVHVPNTRDGIRDGVVELMENYDRYLREVRELRDLGQREWLRKRTALIELVQSAARPARSAC